MVERSAKVSRDRLAYLGSIASGLAHEIKNPLSAMSVNLQMLREDLESSPAPRDLRYLKRVGVLEREVARLDDILQGFLSFTRGYKLEIRPHAVNQLLREVVEFWAADAKGDGIEVELVLEPDLPDVAFDSTYLKQALLNLLINAQQALRDRSGREEGRDQIVVGSRRADEGVEILVIDTGPGISDSHLKRIFEPYFSTKAQGSGLGLAASRRIVEEHGGQLTVQTEVGRGTSFRVFLPLGSDEE